ncbi:MAG: hypothetical protein AAGP08_08420 [Pseudomonadota bacterium]
MRQLLLLMVFGTLSTCGKFPELDAAITDQALSADYPDLVRSDSFNDQRVEGRLTEEDGEELLRRADLLRKRADVIRSIPEINEEARIENAPILKDLGG